MVVDCSNRVCIAVFAFFKYVSSLLFYELNISTSCICITYTRNREFIVSTWHVTRLDGMLLITCICNNRMCCVNTSERGCRLNTGNMRNNE